jgi:2,4-diketo-3-deoxy-L-fuconate hydrolase
MRVATIRHRGATIAAVVLDGDVVAPVSGTTSAADLVGDTLALTADRIGTERIALVDVELLAPIPHPVRNLFCTGWNYLSHFDEGRDRRPDRDLPDVPAYFTKATTTVIGPHAEIPLHAGLTEKLDWEAELAVVIGIGGRDIPESSALDHVFGYTVSNDVSARDLQRNHGGQWFKGKSLDGTCPMGPWIVTADEIGDPQTLEVSCAVDGETVQLSGTDRMIFPVARLISVLSQGLTLLPGDILLTGTPEGVGNSRTPPRYLGAGAVLATTITGIGTLTNRVAP